MAGIQSNRYYNDPQIGQAFSNLAGLFGPPSGSDLAGYAAASAKKEEASRLAEFFSYAKDPTYSREIADRLNYAINGNANNTYYNVDKDAETQRYGYDRTFDASRLNNADDNARAFANARYGALGANQVLPDLPQSVADLYGVPAAVGQTGIITLNPGEQATLPDGRVMSGAVKPLTEGEVKGAERQRLAQSGQLTDQMLLDTIIGAETPVQTVGADGKPVFKSPGTAVREGAQPFINKGAEAKPTNAVALMPDGVTRVPARQDLDGRWVHAQTGQALPENIQIFGLPQATGSASEVGLSPTTSNQTQANNQEAEVTRALNLLDIYEGVVRNNPGSIGLAGLIRGTAQNAAQTATDLAAAFGKSAPQVQEAANEIKQGLEQIAPELFDASIPEIDFLQGTLAYSLARTENPSGEVSRQAFERAYERVKGGGLLANQQSAIAAIGANRKVLQTQLDGIRTLRSPGTGRTDTTFQGTGAAGGQGTATRLKYDANGNLVQ